MNKAEILNPLSFPLHGRRLIEASAGTGKTYTITALYLRLLLGHGELPGEGKPLRVDQILVVTFTEAATEELRDRIRSRIQEAWQVLRGKETSDPLLQQLCQAQSDPEGSAKRLELAVRQMDDTNRPRRLDSRSESSPCRRANSKLGATWPSRLCPTGISVGGGCSKSCRPGSLVATSTSSAATTLTSGITMMTIHSGLMRRRSRVNVPPHLSVVLLKEDCKSNARFTQWF